MDTRKAVLKYMKQKGELTSSSGFYAIMPDGTMQRTVVDTPIPIKKGKPVKKISLNEDEPTYLIRVSRIY